MRNIKTKAKQSAIWSLTGNIGNTVLQIFITAILARLILPESYGIFGTFLIVITLAKNLINPFINKNLILQEENNLLFSSSLIVTLIHAILLIALFWLSAAFIANFFNEPKLEPLIKFGSFILITGGLLNPFQSILEKRLNFKWISLSRITATILGNGLISIILAIYNYQYWALFIGVATYDILMLIFCSVKIKNYWSFPNLKDFKKVYNYSFEIIAGGFINKIALKADYIIVSKFLGMQPLGYYTKAYNLMTQPTSLIATAFNKVGFPALQQAGDDMAKMRSFFLRLVYFSAIILFPISIMGYYLADGIVYVILGPTWMGVVQPLQILIFGLYFRFAYKVGDVVLQILTDFKILLYVQIFYAGQIIILSYFLSVYGISGVAFGVTVALASQYAVIHGITMYKINLSFWEYLKVFQIPFILFFVCFLLFYLTYNLTDFGSLYSFKFGLSIVIISVLAILFIKKKGRIYGKHGVWWFNFLIK